MARYTDAPYRQLCKEHGADVMVTEFVMCESLLRGNAAAWKAVDFSEDQRPMGVQLFGSDPARMAEAAAAVEERLRPDFLDINCGCPASKVTNLEAGSSLLKNPPLLARIVEAVREALKRTPVTVKIRIGWDSRSVNALEVGQRVQDVGAAALAIHGRTKAQGYRGGADWAVIDAVASALDIPVVGNGGVDGVHRAAKLLRESPVAGLMIGRAALGYPWIFAEIKHYLKTGEVPPPPTLLQRWETLFHYCDLLFAHRDDRQATHGLGWMRAKVIAMTKGMPGMKKLRPALDRFQSIEDLLALADEHLAAHGEPRALALSARAGVSQ